MTLAQGDVDWASSLRTDVHALHDDIAVNHPGVVDRLNPRFSAINDAALTLALQRSGFIADYAGYRFAMQAYAAAFDDGHLDTHATASAPPLDASWPGFLTGFDASDRQVVMTREDSAPIPLGAQLESCDGRPAARLAQENIGAFAGRWFLASQRALRGGRLLVDYGNPFVIRPSRCTFLVEGKRTIVDLEWRSIGADALASRLADASPRAHDPIGARYLKDGTYWLSLSGFDGDPERADAKALTALIATMSARRAAIGTARRIILDLRGNNGGSSAWARQIAEILWGEERVAALPDDSYVEWRPSTANVAAMQRIWEQVAHAPEVDDAVRREVGQIVAGITAAHAAARPLWRQDNEPPAPLPGNALARDANRSLPPVFVVTDNGCGSACLSAAELWRTLGAIQVGGETNADTFYLDVRESTLPSGLTEALIPMKIYRNRPRGSNVPLIPHFRYNGDLSQTRKLEEWVASLPSIKAE